MKVPGSRIEDPIVAEKAILSKSAVLLPAFLVACVDVPRVIAGCYILGGRLPTRALLGFQSSWRLDFGWLLVKGHQITEDFQTLRASKFPNLEETACKAIAFRHKVSNPIKYASVISAVSVGIAWLVLLPLAECFLVNSGLLSKERLSTAFGGFGPLVFELSKVIRQGYHLVGVFELELLLRGERVPHIGDASQC